MPRLKRFASPDTALIKKTLQVLRAGRERDLKALDSTPTAAISTRKLMYDDPNSAPDPGPPEVSTHPLSDARELLITHLDAQLAAAFP